MSHHSNKHGFAPMVQQRVKKLKYFGPRKYSLAAYFVATWMAELGSQKIRMVAPMGTVAGVGLTSHSIAVDLEVRAAYLKLREQ